MLRKTLPEGPSVLSRLTNAVSEVSNLVVLSLCFVAGKPVLEHLQTQTLEQVVAAAPLEAPVDKVQVLADSISAEFGIAMNLDGFNAAILQVCEDSIASGWPVPAGIFQTDMSFLAGEALAPEQRLAALEYYQSGLRIYPDSMNKKLGLKEFKITGDLLDYEVKTHPNGTANCAKKKINGAWDPILPKELFFAYRYEDGSQPNTFTHEMHHYFESVFKMLGWSNQVWQNRDCFTPYGEENGKHRALECRAETAALMLTDMKKIIESIDAAPEPRKTNLLNKYREMKKVYVFFSEGELDENFWRWRAGVPTQ